MKPSHRAIILVMVFLFQDSLIARQYLISGAYLPENVNKDGTQGREYEIVKSIFSCMGHTIKIDVQPYFRHIYSFKEHAKYDAAITVPDHELSQLNSTHSHISYHNGATFLTESIGTPEKLEDLAGKHVISFKSAKLLHPKLAKIIPKMTSYQEAAEQLLHVKMLLKGRVDVVLGDGLIIMAYFKDLNTTKKIRFKALLPPSSFHVVFRKKADVPLFNKCLSQLKERQVIQKINQKYLDKYKESLGNEYIGVNESS